MEWDHRVLSSILVNNLHGVVSKAAGADTSL